MSDHTYGGILMADEDLALLREVQAAGDSFAARSAERADLLAELQDHRMVFQRAHPECLAPSTWLAIRLALVQALSDCEGLLMQVHNAELDALQQRIARVRDRGLIEEPTQ